MFEIWLHARMRDHHVDNKKLARAIHVNSTTVGRWVDGETKPERRHSLKLAKFFHVSPATIWRLTDPDVFYGDPGSQEELEDLLAELPELRSYDRVQVRSFVKRSRGLTPQQRAVWLATLKEGGMIPGEPHGEPDDPHDKTPGAHSWEYAPHRPGLRPG